MDDNFTKVKRDIKIAVGLSGGVDSAVSAYLLKNEGYDVCGVHMQCWDYSSETCKGNEDRSDAVSVCSHLGIKFQFLNFEKEYKERVINYFYNDYRNGRTPNPDVMCNSEIKFGMFLEWALSQGFDYIATGHYARIKKDLDSYKLLKGVDQTKDQSYFLYRLNARQLSKCMFPVGGVRKSEVRKIAEESKLPVAKKKESMGICFVGEVDIRKFLQRELLPKSGDVILKSTGEVVGKHDGIWFYTIGQRHGFSLTKYVGLPLYVCGKDVKANILYVGYYKDCLSVEFEIGDMSFINPTDTKHNGPSGSFSCDVRIRHLGQLYPATITLLENGNYGVGMQEEAFGIASGQSAVLYDGDIVLGGGIIQ